MFSHCNNIREQKANAQAATRTHTYTCKQIKLHTHLYTEAYLITILLIVQEKWVLQEEE